MATMTAKLANCVVTAKSESVSQQARAKNNRTEMTVSAALMVVERRSHSRHQTVLLLLNFMVVVPILAPTGKQAVVLLRETTSSFEPIQSLAPRKTLSGIRQNGIVPNRESNGVGFRPATQPSGDINSLNGDSTSILVGLDEQSSKKEKGN